MTENLGEKSLINPLIVMDYMKSNNYKPFNILLTNKYIRRVGDAHREYTKDLLKRKKKELFQEKDKKKKQRKTLLENTITGERQ